MKYQERSFTLPTNTARLTDQEYDLRVLTAEEFCEKYKLTIEEYRWLTQPKQKIVTRRISAEDAII